MQPNLKASLLMVAAAACFGLMSAIIRAGGEHLHAFQIAFFRNLFGLVFMLPWLLRIGWKGFHTDKLGWFTVRAFLGVAAMLLFFWALTEMPLADAIALSFSTPLWVTLTAGLVLGEVVRARRWTATLVGFAGALIILRPGLIPLSGPALAVLLSTALMGASVLLIKYLSRTQSTGTIVLYMGLLMTPLSALPAIPVWQWPDLEAWALMVALGATGTAGHLFFTQSMQEGEASFVMTFDFVRLPVAAVLGYWWFGQTADAWTWVGAIVIFGAGLYIAHREAGTQPRPVPAPPISDRSV